MNQVRDAECVYIYGAGVIGRAINKYLKKCDINVTAFLVTSCDEKKMTVDGLPVFQFDKARLGMNDLVVIAVKEMYYRQVEEILLQGGIIQYTKYDDICGK